MSFRKKLDDLLRTRNPIPEEDPERDKIMEDLVSNLSEKDINLDYNSDDKTIGCSNGKRARVYIHNGHVNSPNEAYCITLLGEIHLGSETDTERNSYLLLHEKGHFDIFPYGVISYIGAYAASMYGGLNNVKNSLDAALFGVATTLFFLHPLIRNVWEDWIVDAVNYFRYGKKLKRSKR